MTPNRIEMARLILQLKRLGALADRQLPRTEAPAPTPSAWRWLGKGTFFGAGILVAIYAPKIVQSAGGRSNPIMGNLNSNGHRNFGIKDVISEVRNELADEQTSLGDQQSLFTVKSFDLELNFVLRSQSSTKASAAPVPELITVDNQIDSGSETVQKITLHMDTVPEVHKSFPASSAPVDPVQKIAKPSHRGK